MGAYNPAGPLDSYTTDELLDLANRARMDGQAAIIMLDLTAAREADQEVRRIFSELKRRQYSS